jgi:hypothetical protein
MASFTQELKVRGTKVRAFFEDRFPDAAAARADLRERVRDSQTLDPSDTAGYPWGTVGTALDYRVRFSFPAYAALPDRWDIYVDNPDVGFGLINDLGNPGSLPRPLVAELVASTARIDKGAHVEAASWSRAASRFFGDFSVFLRRVRPHELSLHRDDEERLCRFCYVLALYDEIKRNPVAAWAGTPLLNLQAMAGVDDMLALCSRVAAADIAEMSRAFVFSQSRLLAGRAVLNPHFSHGGDGDLIVDGCYIDIKAARVPKRPSPTEWPWELLGYALFDAEDTFEIRSVGLYLARQAQLVTWSLEEFMSMLSTGGDSPPSLGTAREALRTWLTT